jgi:hypothetical protein
VRQLIDGHPLTPMAAQKPKPPSGDSQQVIKPEGGLRIPPIMDGGESPHPA